MINHNVVRTLETVACSLISQGVEPATVETAIVTVLESEATRLIGIATERVHADVAEVKMMLRAHVPNLPFGTTVHRSLSHATRLRNDVK